MKSIFIDIQIALTIMVGILMLLKVSIGIIFLKKVNEIYKITLINFVFLIISSCIMMVFPYYQKVQGLEQLKLKKILNYITITFYLFAILLGILIYVNIMEIRNNA